MIKFIVLTSERLFVVFCFEGVGEGLLVQREQLFVVRFDGSLAKLIRTEG